MVLFTISSSDFARPTRLQYNNSLILLGNRCMLQQQHVDCKIADALSKRGTKQHADGWDASSKAWAHMVLHLSHAEGGLDRRCWGRESWRLMLTIRSAMLGQRVLQACLRSAQRWLTSISAAQLQDFASVGELERGLFAQGDLHTVESATPQAVSLSRSSHCDTASSEYLSPSLPSSLSCSLRGPSLPTSLPPRSGLGSHVVVLFLFLCP
jgi:hypothetical protein